MFKMTADRGNKGQRLPGGGSDSAFVLPRIMRRPIRLFGRFLSGDIAVSPRFEGVLFSSVIAGAALYGSILGGQFPIAVERATLAMGLGVNEIKIEGHTHTRPEDVFAVLGLEGQRSLFSIDPDTARASLAQLPWIEHGEIRKTYPDRLTITVDERKPFAIWQTGETLSVIERDGSVIGGYSGNSLRHLPLLVGKGAADQASDFFETVAMYPAVHDQVRAYVHVGQRRWDLRLINGMTLRLPELDVERSLARAATLQATHGVFDRDIASIDLRFDDRVVFALTENAMIARKAMLDAQEIEMTRQGDSI